MSSMSFLPRNPLLLSFSLLLSLLFSNPVYAMNVSFYFPSFPPRNLTLLGDSYFRNGSVGLTRETGVPSSSAGSALYNLPILFYDARTNTSASFSTSFSFSIKNMNSESYGDGLTFFISAHNQTLGSIGGYMGLFNSTEMTKKGSIIAVEFDTFLDKAFNDSSSNHVGFDIDSPVSVKSEELGPYGVDLKSSNLITAWIDYDNNEKMFMVWLGYSTVKPGKPLLSTRFDLSKHFEEFMYVGFSASTEGSTEVHMISGWSFQTFGFPTLNLSSQILQNVSDTSWTNFPTISVSEPRNTSHRKLSLGLWITCPIVFCMIFVMFIWVSIKKFREIKDGDNNIKGQFLKGPRQFSYSELSSATRGFNRSRIIGSGAFGTVYRATPPGSANVYAVKRSKHSHQSKNEFLAELSIIARLRHKNLVQLQGWCAEKGELLLVYEFMPNGSLDRVLYHGNESGTSSRLKWPQRYNITIGIASVLTYLHQECEQQVIHRDIKTSNILLDANFSPRLGDFGLARLMEHNKSPVSTLTAGTMGYLAPEYVQYGKATEKTDVFSFGVVILEVCCGKRPIDIDNGRAHNLVNLVDWAWGLHSEDKLIEAVDPRLNGEFNKEEMVRLLRVGLSCVHPNCTERPSMRKVLQILNSEVEPITVPKMKPCLTFTCTLPLSLKEIVSDSEESVTSSPLYDLKIY